MFDFDIQIIYQSEYSIIWTTEETPPIPTKEYRVQILTNYESPLLDMKTSWPSEGDLLFVVFRKKGQQLKYVGKESTHTPGTLRVIPLRVLNILSKLTTRKLSINSEVEDKIYPNYAKNIRKADLAPTNFLTMGDLCSKQDEKVEIEK